MLSRNGFEEHHTDHTEYDNLADMLIAKTSNNKHSDNNNQPARIHSEKEKKHI